MLPVTASCRLTDGRMRRYVCLLKVWKYSFCFISLSTEKYSKSFQNTEGGVTRERDFQPSNEWPIWPMTHWPPRLWPTVRSRLVPCCQQRCLHWNYYRVSCRWYCDDDVSLPRSTSVLLYIRSALVSTVIAALKVRPHVAITRRTWLSQQFVVMIWFFSSYGTQNIHSYDLDSLHEDLRCTDINESLYRCLRHNNLPSWHSDFINNLHLPAADRAADHSSTHTEYEKQETHQEMR